ncbi:unnamed protein product [Calypogeia fissa]
MRSSYPSSQSFFDSTSDSIRAEDVDKCRSSASFSTLADLFTNPSCKSDLFPNTRAPFFIQEEVRFPERKKRECEERTSIWHEWGSGECQSENVAEESSGFISDSTQGGKFPILSSSSFPNLGSAIISLSTEFTFPARKKREEGSSWREERTSWQDWTPSVAPKRQEPAVTGSSPVVGSIRDMYLSNPCTKPFDSLSSSKSSPFSSLGAPAKSASEEVSFPARKKREERSFWQQSNVDGSAQFGCEVMATPRNSASGVGSLAEMYTRKTGSGLFSTGAVNGTDEVIFPKRRNNADRNAWRDWTNTGYGDCDHDTDQDSVCIDNSLQPTSPVVMETDGLTTAQVDSQCSIDVSGRFSVSENLPASECVLRSSVHELGGCAASAMLSSSRQVQACEKLSVLCNGEVRNVDMPGCPHHRGGRTMDGGEASDGVDDIQTEADDREEVMFPNSTSEQSGGSTGEYPPPLRSLPRQGQIRVPNHMPWVQLQPFRSKGRFVLQEVKVTQPVVFQPIRKEGRLVLQFIGQENKYQKGDAGARHLRNGLVAEDKATLATEKIGLNESVMVKTEAKVVVEKKAVRQSVDNAKRAEGTERRKNSKVRTSISALVETERSKKSAKVWPVVCTPWEALPGGEILFARTDEGGGDLWDRKFNFRELCFMLEEIVPSDRRGPERERAVALEGDLIQDRPPPWLLGKLCPDGRNFDVRNSLQTVTQIRNAVDRLVQNGNLPTIPRGSGENAPFRLQFQTLPRTSSLRSGLSGLNCPRVDGGGALVRTKSIKGSSLSDVTAPDTRKEDTMTDSGRGRAQELRSSLSVYQWIIRDSLLSLATAHSFLRSLRTRPDIPGEHDLRVSNCKPPVASVFSCADGVGKGHHEKNFWEQQPCVS